jgi:hypothetical protein
MTNQAVVTDERWMTAYRINPEFDMKIVPAPRGRDWMGQTPGRSATRCLPLLVANEAGWALLNPRGFSATWDGGNDGNSVTLEWDEQPMPGAEPVIHNFGSGIISWRVPYLFRTPPGWNILVRGPANSPRDGASPLEGLVETDWAVMTFTMNWKLTRPGHSVRFDTDEPICMIVPQRRRELESFSASVQWLEDDPEAAAHFEQWSRDRQLRQFLSEYGKDLSEPGRKLEYFKGQFPLGATKAPEHQTKLRLAQFAADQPDDRTSA